MTGLQVVSLQGPPGSGWVFRARHDPALSISILLDGRMRVAIDDDVPGMLDAGQVLWMFMDREIVASHDWKGHPDFHMVHIHLEPHVLPELAGLEAAGLPACLRPSAGMGYRMSILVGRRLQRLAAEIGQCACRHPQARSICLRGKVLEVLAAVIEQGARIAGDLSRYDGGCRDRRSLLQARDLLERHGDQAWTVPVLARTVGLNEKRLQAGFRHLFGMTVHDCLIRIRLDQSARLLLAGGSVTETAQAVGFASLSHFSKAFRLRHGSSPRSWLREFRSPG